MEQSYVDKNYVQRNNDSISFAIRNTISHLGTFFIIAVTKRFNVNRSTLYLAISFVMNKKYKQNCIPKKQKSKQKRQNTQIE